MLSKWPIRNKLLVGMALLVVIVTTLSVSGFKAIYSYRGLVKSLRGRATELPLATEFGQKVADLRVTLTKVWPGQDSEQAASAFADTARVDRLNAEFLIGLKAVEAKLAEYRSQLDTNDQDEDDSAISGSQNERQTMAKIDRALKRIEAIHRQSGWLGQTDQAEEMHNELTQLQLLAVELPSHLHTRIHSLAGEVRLQYRTLIGVTAVVSVSAAIMLAVFIQLFYRWLFRPLHVLVEGSRCVAAGDFYYRIKLQTHDEMSELADAMNDMTARFQAIRDDLDRQVQIRTKQVVRSEQLASVGFLAAGVAHEINNPLASIAMCAESLEDRLKQPTSSEADQKVIRNYLRMIQSEAFRCKGITERLLDFSRIGEVRPQSTELTELVHGVIDMVRHLGKYNEKNIKFSVSEAVLALVNAQEIKQVVLNLITNGLDSLDTGGTLTVELGRRDGMAELIVSDDGCGMTAEVLEHLFEPFFTRKRGGQGTGLGLSIAYRIVADHGGHIEATSDGPGRGSRFRVTLPLAASVSRTEHRYQAA